ncbi:MAG: metallophosphoesterase, partial [Acidimicrobiales bacterium]
MTAEGFRRRPRVRWLAPSVLARTVQPVFLSGLFARFSDRREVEAVLPQGVIDLSDGDEMWVDYVADTGDGFDATATVASLLAPEVLTVDGHRTEAGALLVLGGDEVYPYASIEAYKDRFIGPFRAMLPRAEPGRLTVALPGNHDWYDGLTAFLQVFCGGQWIGGWKTVQRRSYFACKLPNRWWLWGIDIQLETYIDHP